MARKWNSPRFFVALAGNPDAAKLLKKKARVYAGYLLDSLRGNQTHKTGAWTLSNNRGYIKVSVWKDILGARVKAFLYADPITPESIPIVRITFTVDDYICGILPHDSLKTKTVNDVEVKYLDQIVKTSEGVIRDRNDVAEYKMAVPLNSIFSTLADDSTTTEYAQTRRVEAGRYTGYMRLLIQLLIGIGVRQTPNYEQWMISDERIDAVQITEEERAEKEAELETKFKAYEPGSYIQVGYHYSHTKTHGLTLGVGDKCYIVQISADGIYAMPLPVTALSQTEEMREQIQLLYPELFVEDLSGLTLFDYFGGFPTGEWFPIKDDLEDRVKAGDILKLAESSVCADFYDKQAYSSTMGWAFAPLTPMAVNTCYDYDSATNVSRGYLYTVIWSIGAWEEPEWGEYQNILLGALDAEGLITEDWHVSKCRRLGTSTARSIYTEVSRDAEAGWEAFLDAEVNPVAIASANMELMDEGWLYHPTRYAGSGNACATVIGHPQYKTPNEDLGYNVSFDFSAPEDDPDITVVAPTRCDTPVWAGWIQDQLHIIRYYWDSDGTEEIEPEYATREECQYTGTWFDTTESRTQVQGNFYSNKFDLRERLDVTGYINKMTVGRWAGTQDYMGFPEFFGRCACIVKNVFAQYDVYTDISASSKRYSGIAAPFSDRSIMYTATLDVENGAQQKVSVGTPVNVGNTGFTRYGRLYEFVCHWALCSCPGDDVIDDGGPQCKLKEMAPMDEVESCLSDFGPPAFPPYMPCTDGYDYRWPPGGPIECALNKVYEDSVPDTEAYYDASAVVTVLKWETRIWGDIQNNGSVVRQGRASGEDLETFADAGISSWWFLSSPTCPPPLWCKIDASTNYWGDPIVNYHDDIDYSKDLHYGVLTSMHSNSRATFVGYVSQEVFDHGEPTI